MGQVQSLEQLRSIGRQIDAAERAIRLAGSKVERYFARKRLVSLRRAARSAAQSHSHTWGR